ncbi:hypothetical protein [Streptomyces canus]|uniref:hypothetical protein n=1 Tax=Streptomyces canus TaxID=58343 RepID=UPI0030E3262C
MKSAGPRGERLSPASPHPLEGGPIDSGHHMAEEAPEKLVGALHAFWANAGHLAGSS